LVVVKSDKHIIESSPFILIKMLKLIIDELLRILSSLGHLLFIKGLDVVFSFWVFIVGFIVDNFTFVVENDWRWFHNVFDLPP